MERRCAERSVYFFKVLSSHFWLYFKNTREELLHILGGNMQKFSLVLVVVFKKKTKLIDKISLIKKKKYEGKEVVEQSPAGMRCRPLIYRITSSYLSPVVTARSRNEVQQNPERRMSRIPLTYDSKSCSFIQPGTGRKTSLRSACGVRVCAA